MREKNELLRELAKTNPDRALGNGKEYDVVSKEQDRYARDKLMMEVLLDLRSMLEDK